jgi:hypothetical protein
MKWFISRSIIQHQSAGCGGGLFGHLLSAPTCRQTRLINPSAALAMRPGKSDAQHSDSYMAVEQHSPWAGPDSSELLVEVSELP